ncbi:hypothetical protein NFI96_028340 [Prochilodus magdalenae]|nr:hypothetical protein NFI96_028340 [Prochilodus magdalenae]
MLWVVMENRNVPLMWTNQISAQTSASKTLALISPQAPVSEMERSRVALITLMCVLISCISEIIVEMRVKPGDNATIYCDCTYQSKFTLVWFIKPSNEHQPPLINLTEDSTPPRYSRVWNYTKGTYDLLVKNITESDLGLYYCALHEIKLTRDRNGERVREDVYHEGNRTTFLSFLDAAVPCTAAPQTPSTLQTTSTTPPVSDCSVCWKLLVSVCLACVLLSSVVSSTCVYCIYRGRTKADRTAERGGNMEMRNHNKNYTKGSYDLLVENITESDLGLYYCALHEIKITRDRNGTRVREETHVPLFPGLKCGWCAAGVWFSRISGEEVEVKVRPGDNAVLYSDCNWKHGFSMVWFRNSSHEHMVIHEEAHPRYFIVWSSFSKTSDLLVRNVSESDLGLYYCALHKTWPIRDKARACSGEDVCLYGNRTTRLSFHGEVTLVLVNANVFIA